MPIIKNTYFFIFTFTFPLIISAQIYSSSLYGKAVTAYNSAKYETAYQNFKLLENKGIPQKEFYVYFAMSAKKAGHNDALEILRRGLQLYPGDNDLSIILAQQLSAEKKFKEAMDVLQKAKQSILPDEYNQMISILAFNEGVNLYRKNYKKKSLVYFKKAVDYNNHEPRFIRNLSIVLWETGETQEAVALLEKYLPQFADDSEMNKLLMAFYQKKGELKKLQNSLENNVQKNGKLTDYLILEQFYLVTGNENKANQLFESMKQLFPKNKEVYLTKVRYYRRVFRYYQADSVLAQLEKHFPQDTLVCKLKAMNYENMDSLKLAAYYWKKCSDIYPEKSQWYFNRLRNLKQVDSLQYAANLDSLANLLSADDDVLRLSILLLQNNQVNKSFQLLKKLNMSLPNNGTVKTYLGLCYQRLKSDSLAIVAFNEAIAAEDPLPQAYMSLSHYYWQSNNRVLSDKYFKLGLNLMLTIMRSAQNEILQSLNKNGLIGKSTSLNSTASEYENFEQLMRQELKWYMKNHSSADAQHFLSSLLKRYPKNVFLRLMLADLMINDNQTDQAAAYINDALFIKPGNPEALRKKFFLQK